MTQTLLDDVSPLGNIRAVVEADKNACYFYLFGADDTDFGVRSVWVRNLKPAPERFDVDTMERGEPPLNPRAHCKSSAAGTLPNAEDLGVCWLPEGNCAALIEGDVILAMIPPWSGQGGFNGYARDCIGQGPVAWEMPQDPTLQQRFQRANEFWETWDDDSWPNIQDALTESIERVLGKHSNYYAIDGGDWPPRAILRIPTTSGTALVTLGVSILPQPNLETDNASQLRRIELGAILPSTWSDAQVKQFASYLSGQARLPWRAFTWLGPGHTIPCDDWASTKFTAALLQREHPALPKSVTLPPQFGDPVHVLWFIPITEAEREYAISNGSSALAATLPSSRWREG